MNEKSDVEILVNLVFDENSVENHLRGAACDMARIEIIFNAISSEENRAKELHQEKYEILRKVFFETACAEFLKIFSPAEIKELVEIHKNPLVQRFLTKNSRLAKACENAILKKAEEHLQKLELQQSVDSADFKTIN